MNILITGARSNIGYNLAKALALRGHIVYACCKTLKEKEGLDEIINNEKIIMFPLVLNLLDNDFGIIDSLDLDILILQASISNGGSILEISHDRFKEVMDVNIMGNFKLLQRFLRCCYYHHKLGKIFLTSSLGALYPLPYLASYTTSKMALITLLDTLKLELLYQRLNVSVSLILPGAYHTGFNDLMIENKSLDDYLLKDKSLKMTKYQKIMFSLLEKDDYKDLINQIVLECESKKPKYIISRPISQKILTKLYIIIKSIIV